MDPTTWKPDETPIHLINPLTKSVIVEMRNDDNSINKVEVPSLEMSTYPKWQADILLNHIVDAMINERSLGYVSPEERQKLEKEVIV